MRRRTALRMGAILALCLLAGGALLGASTAGPPGPPPGPPPPPTPPPEPEPTPPPQPVYPCVLEAPLPPEMDAGLRAARSIDDPPIEIGSWLEPGPLYESGPFKIFINPEFQGLNALLNLARLQQGAYIGLLQASVPFQFAHRGGERCPPPPVGAARSIDDGSYLLWMANAPVLGIKIPPEMIALNWFVALVKVKIPFEPDIGGIIFYPDARYRSPEEMLKAARALDDGGILMPLPPETH